MMPAQRALLVLVAALACDQPAAPAPASSPQVVQYCHQKLARDSRCGSAPRPDAEARCQADAGCLERLLRSDVVGPLFSCITQRACGVSDDPCFHAAASGPAGDPTALAYQNACFAKRDACKIGATLGEDHCVLAALLKPALLASAIACLNQPCAAVESCLDSLVECPR